MNSLHMKLLKSHMHLFVKQKLQICSHFYTLNCQSWTTETLEATAWADGSPCEDYTNWQHDVMTSWKFCNVQFTHFGVKFLITLW